MLLRRQTTTAADVEEWSPTSQVLCQTKVPLEEQGDKGWRGKGVKVECKTHKASVL